MTHNSLITDLALKFSYNCQGLRQPQYKVMPTSFPLYFIKVYITSTKSQVFKLLLMFTQRCDEWDAPEEKISSKREEMSE